MIAVLRYKNSEYTKDGNVVFFTITSYGVEIIKTQRFMCFGYPKVTIQVDSVETLNQIVCDINKQTVYEVSIVRTRKRGK